MPDFQKIVYVCVSHAVLDVRKVFFMCNGIVFQCFGVFWGIFEWFWGVSSKMYLTNWVKGSKRDKFSNLEQVLRYFSEVHCLHGLEALISIDVTQVEIPPQYAKLHRLDT